MKRLARIYKVFFRSSLVRELEFRANFFAKIIENILWALFFIVFVETVYYRTPDIAGWSKGDAFVLSATTFLTLSLWDAFFQGSNELPQHVRKGSLDYIVTRPVDPQFWVSLRRFNFNQIGATLAGIGMLIYGLSHVDRSPLPQDIAAYIFCLACGIFTFYSFNLALMATAIWFVRVDNLWVLSDTLITVGRNPLDIYGAVMQKTFLFVLPIAILGTLPARQLTVGLQPDLILICVVWCLVLTVFARWFFLYALRNYTSASS